MGSGELSAVGKHKEAVVFKISKAVGVPNMSTEEGKAFEGYKAKAEKGDLVAQNNLGGCSKNGEGEAKDQVEAVKWYWKAAGQGDANAYSMWGFPGGTGSGIQNNLRWRILGEGTGLLLCEGAPADADVQHACEIQSKVVPRVGAQPSRGQGE